MKLVVEPDEGLTPILQALKRARTSIALTIFRFGREEVERALSGAVERGVLVRALIAHTNGAGAQKLRQLEERFLERGVTVTRTSDELRRYHAKFMVVDDTLHVFGFNFTKQDVDRSRSFAISTKDRRSVAEALKLFEADSTRQVYSPSRSNLVVSPETARTMLAKFLRGARKELAIYDAKLQDPDMLKILENRAKKGVSVRVIGSAKTTDSGVSVRPLKGRRLHVRAVIRDATRAFVGSQSLRSSELDRRREVGLLISNPAVTRALMKIFETDWLESARPKDIKENVPAEPRQAAGNG